MKWKSDHKVKPFPQNEVRYHGGDQRAGISLMKAVIKKLARVAGV